MSYIDLYLQTLLTQGKGEPLLYIFGVPFDSTCSYKPGTRFGPNAIREAFINIEYNSFYNDDKIVITDLCIKDLGNLKFTVNPQYMVEMVNKVSKEVMEKGFTCILGGEHLLTLGTFLATKHSSLVIFDAHYDLRDEYNDTKYNHATFLRRIIEERGADNILHLAARAFSKEEIEFVNRYKIKSIKCKELHNNIKIVKDHLSALDDIYVSIDLDCIDPAFAPGVGTPEPLGLTSKQFFDIINMFSDHKIRAFDIVELSPPYDNGSTAILAAKIIIEFIIMKANKTIKSN